MSASATRPLGKRPARVLVVLHVDKHSGPQLSLQPRLRALRDQGVEVSTLVPGPGPAQEVARELGDVSIGIPGALLAPRSPLDLMRAAGAMRAQHRCVLEATRRAEAELVVVSSALMPGALAGARAAGAGVMVYSGEPPPAGKRALVAGVVDRYAARRAGAIVVPSEFAAERWQRLLPDVFVVPPVIEPPDRGAADRGAALRESLGIPEGAKVICTLGAITEGRGQLDLLAAWEAGVGVDCEVLIAGGTYDRPKDGDYLARLRDEIDRGGAHRRVRLLGELDDPRALFAAADVFVNPVRVPETFGRAACEALLAGCAVVASDIGGISEALTDGETALLVPPGDAGALNSALRRVLAEPELARRLGEAGRRDVSQRLTQVATSEPFLAALERASGG